MRSQMEKAQDCPASLQLSQQLQLPNRASGSIEFSIWEREGPWDKLGDQWQGHSAQREEKMLLAMGPAGLKQAQ